MGGPGETGEHLADRAVGNQLPDLLVSRHPAALVPGGQLHAVPLAGRQHGVALAGTAGHRFLRHDGARCVARGGQDGHPGVMLLRRADAQQVRLFLAQHGFVVGVTVLDVELVAELCQRVGIEVTHGHEVGSLALQVALGVAAADVAAHDDGAKGLGAHEFPPP